MQFNFAKRDSHKAWFVCISGALFFFFDFVQIGIKNTLGNEIMKEFRIDSYTLGYVTFCFSLANFLFLFPAGAAIRRYPLRNITLSALALSVTGAFGTALSGNFWLMCFFRFLSGTAHAFCFICCTTLVNHWFSPDKRAFVMGVVVAIGVSGVVIAQAPLATLAASVGWQKALLANAVLGLVIWGMAFLFVREAPDDFQIEATRAGSNIFKELKEAAKNKKTWLFALYIALLNTPYAVIGIDHLNKFLRGGHGVAEKTGSMISMYFFLGNLIGAPVAGFVSERWQSRKQPMLFGGVLTFGFVSLLLFVTSLPVFVLGVVAFLAGAFISAQVIAYPAIAECNAPALIAAAMSITSSVVMGSIPLFQQLTNLILAYAGEESYKTYLYGFIPVVLAVAGAIAIAFIVEDTYKKSDNTSKRQKN